MYIQITKAMPMAERDAQQDEPPAPVEFPAANFEWLGKSSQDEFGLDLRALVVHVPIPVRFPLPS